MDQGLLAYASLSRHGKAVQCSGDIWKYCLKDSQAGNEWPCNAIDQRNLDYSTLNLQY